MRLKKLTILTADAKMRLVWRESVAAFSRAGHTVSAGEELAPRDIAKIFALPPERSGLSAHPSLFFSVNFNGLDKHGEVFAECRRCGLPVAVWCVDNPWNLLSGLRDDFWKETLLFVTDPSFIPDLKRHGAKAAHFLPLATDPDVFKLKTEQRETKAPAVFVGRSSFPDKERFFVGQSIPENLLETAFSLLPGGGRPDFSWWLEKLYPEGAALWPGSAARRAALGAEESSLAWRGACLEAAASVGLEVYGDTGWKDWLPENVSLLPPVDYYNGLAEVYAGAPFSLVMMSYLLPHALNQRHFDIWAAGGFALLDAAPGLNLFPAEMAEPVTFKTPADIPRLIRYFSTRPDDKKHITEKWRELVLAEHTYDVRIRDMIATIFS